MDRNKDIERYLLTKLSAVKRTLSRNSKERERLLLEEKELLDALENIKSESGLESE